jgi:hypothetical protein
MQKCRTAGMQAGMQKCGNAEMQECRNARMQECRNAGMQEFTLRELKADS